MTDLNIFREDILANRQKWIAFLMWPGRKKAKGGLDDGSGRRCCLGHACYVLKIERVRVGNFFAYGSGTQVDVAPDELVCLVGLYSRSGSAEQGHVLERLPAALGVERCSLVNINDCTDATPQEIGAYLQTVIEGGPDTPFWSLSDYKPRPKAQP